MVENSVDFIFDKVEEDIALDDKKAEAKAQEDANVEKYFLDYSAEMAKPVSVIYDPTNPDRIIVSEDNIFVIAGEAKSYKSFCASRLTIDFFEQHPDGKVIIVDTEQADWNCANIGHRICKAMGWDYRNAVERKQLRIANLRSYSYKERLAITEKIVKAECPNLCIVDGVRDMVHDINESSECMDVVDALMRWSKDYHCTIGCVLHTNKDGDTLRGHLGSELQNKAETVLFCKRKEDGYGAHVTAKYSRNIAIDDFDIEIDSRYVPIRAAKPSVEVANYKVGTAKETACINKIPALKHQAKERWLEQIIFFAECAPATAEKWFKDYVNAGIIVPDGYDTNFYTHKEQLELTEQVDTQTSFEDITQDPF